MPEAPNNDDQIQYGEKQTVVEASSSVLNRHDSRTSTSDQSILSSSSHSSHGSLEGPRPTAHDSVQPPNLIRATTTNSTVGPTYSVFTTNQKRFIVFMASWAGFFSPVSGQIYFPALNALSTDLKVSNTLINLTLTSYMIFQGIAPTLIGDLADTMGRRPAYFACFIIYIAANIGLALQNSYAALFVLRCIQSSGSSGTIAMASGIVSDIATASERGSYMGFTLAGSLLGPAIGPVLGGILTQFLGWRSIFWFLTILGSAFLIVFAIFFPETARNQVGNGSIAPKGYNMSLMNYLAIRKARNAAPPPPPTSSTTLELIPTTLDELSPTKLHFPNPLSSLHILFDVENALLLLYNAFLFAAFYDITASIPSQFATIYSFNDLQIGLCYIPAGLGSMAAALVNGQLLDRNYARWCKNLNVPIRKGRQQDLSNFPIEKARLQIAIPAAYVTCAMTLVFGWVLDCERPPPLGVILTVLFFTTFSMSVAFNVTSTLLVDFYPRSPATATAANNLVRCLLGAGATAAVVPMIGAMGRGWTFSVLSALLLGGSPMLWVVYFRGVRMRKRRGRREEEEEDLRRKEGEKGGGLEDGEVAVRVQSQVSEFAAVGESEIEKEKEEPERGGEGRRTKNTPWHPNTLNRTLSHHSAG